MGKQSDPSLFPTVRVQTFLSEPVYNTEQFYVFLPPNPIYTQNQGIKLEKA